MPLAACRQCGASLDEAFRFCPWCAAPLRTKLVEFFRTHRRLRPPSAINRSADLAPLRMPVRGEFCGAGLSREFVQDRSAGTEAVTLAVSVRARRGFAARRSSTGSRKNTSSTSEPERADVGHAARAEPVADAADEPLGSGRAGGDADGLAPVEPALVDLASRRRSGATRRPRRARPRRAGSSSSCSASRSRAGGRPRAASSLTAACRFVVA